MTLGPFKVSSLLIFILIQFLLLSKILQSALILKAYFLLCFTIVDGKLIFNVVLFVFCRKARLKLCPFAASSLSRGVTI